VLSRAAIRQKCAFTYMNAVSGKNLTGARAVDANDVRTALDTGAAFGGATGIAPSRRMIMTCMLPSCGSGTDAVLLRRFGAGRRGAPTREMRSSSPAGPWTTGW
jgi:hypothetical protein